jgi:septal ring factor EnvC (AmiA/AmiB activator)
MSDLAIKALATVILVAGLIFGFNVFVDHQRDIGYQQRASEDAVQLNADLQAARERTERLFRIHDKALTEGAQREQALKNQLSSARAASGRLRDDLAEYRRRLSEYSDATARAYADTGLRLLGECQERYRDMAAIAQGHYNDWRTLNEAWPQ